jgi:adenosine deaminase
VIPKVELHLHLEGAAPPAFIRGLAREKGADIGGIFDAAGNYAFGDFAGFLRVYETATGVLSTPADYARLTGAVLGESAANGVVYTEVFISPDFCGGGDLGAWREHVAAIAEAAAPFDDTITLRGIVTCIRHFGPAKARAAALCAAETAGGFITGFGIAGDERAGRAADFAWAFDCAREAGLGLTAHAGEWAGPDSIRDALAAFRPARLGHGVRAVEDPALLDRLAADGTVLEVCPGSNIALGLYPDWRRHPIAALDRRGLRVTVSTDDPPFFATSMEREYARLAEAFGWDAAQFARLNRTALDAAFCDADTRARIAKRLEASA